MYLNNYLGRRLSLAVTGAVSIVGVVIEVTSAVGGKGRFGQFVAGKTIASIAMGLAVNIVPVYLSETSTGAARGFAVSLYQNVQILGVILASGVVYASSRSTTASAYLTPIGLQFIAPMIMIVASPFLPESPRWLVWKGRHEEARSAASRLFLSSTNSFDAAKYIDEIQIAIEAERSNENAASWADLMHGPDLRRLLIAVGVQSLQQAQGSSYMNSYIVSFLTSTGVTNVFPVIMGLYTLYYVAVLTGHFLPDTAGRRPILISTALFCGVTLTIVSSLVVAYSNPPDVAKKASIALIFLWQTSFGVQSPLIWITTVESAPSRNREKVQAIACFFGFGVSLLITSVSPYIQDESHGNLGGKIGFIWGAFSFITAAWVYFIVPEMKGFTIEQLDYLYDHGVPTLKFKGYQFDSIDGESISVFDKKVESQATMKKMEDQDV
ncbi:general substrate transporter [Didymella exigua CBS 183.55]|uniref:General substrate transporter n=1 Tax=Didymella exigua CBS 183.55 TaxID=1150837 RepID=A0A6A5R999_9PLEO|nr:general substrate transporter [Didymella exigua CBS 183.55]KAF1923820.1 general substrate transporter [Didymella exigua CBS 183.55]